MKSIINVLEWLNENWSALVIIAGLCIALYKKIAAWAGQSTDDKVRAAKLMLRKTILSYVTDAEKDWVAYKKSGKLKESDVFKNIYKDYPILAKFKNQDEMIMFITSMIDDALEDMESTLNDNGNNGVESLADKK